MKKRLLPVPLILLIPILLLIVVVAAGLYRFSMSDEEILAKFPSTQQKQDEILKAVFSISTPNPWTIEVPDSHAFSFIDTYNEQAEQVTGKYDDGVERGTITIFTKWMLTLSDTDYVSVMSVSNQGSGVFYYLSRFHYDTRLKRMVRKESHLLGDRIQLESLSQSGDHLYVDFFIHGDNQAMIEEPSTPKTAEFQLSSSGVVSLIE